MTGWLAGWLADLGWGSNWMVDTDADVEELVYSNAAVEWSRYSYDEGSKSIGRGTMDEKCMLRHIGRSLEFEQNRHTTSKEEKKTELLETIA